MSAVKVDFATGLTVVDGDVDEAAIHEAVADAGYGQAREEDAIVPAAETGQTSQGGGAERSPTMRAVVRDRYGAGDHLTISALDIPSIAADEVLIEVASAGLDRGTWHAMTGRPYLIRLAGFGVTKPKSQVLGFDVSGTVVAVGADVQRFVVGDEVFGIARGSFAEFAAAKEEKLAHKPNAVSFEEAAVAAISGIAALQAVVDVGGVETGQSVLVIGASGGVGTYAVQLAKTLGATVTGVASAAKCELVRGLGADEVVDYALADYLDGTSRYDVIIDTGGLNPVSRMRRALKETGTLVIVGGEGGGSLAGGIGRQLWARMLSPFVSQQLTFFLSTEDYRHIEALATLMQDGAVIPSVGQRYQLDEVPQAMADLEAGSARGKSVIVVKGR